MITKYLGQILQQSGKISVIALLLSFSYLAILKAQTPHTRLSISKWKATAYGYYISLFRVICIWDNYIVKYFHSKTI